MLKSVRTPEGATIRFEYDALGRRTLKETHDTCHRYAWDGNVLLHEWSYDRREKPRMEKDELGRIRYDRQEPHTNLITWVYDGGSYTPVAKLTEEDSYSIVQDYPGTPIQALDSKGEVVWDCILDIYGDVLELRDEKTSYLSDSKDSMRMVRRGCTTTGTDTTRPRWVPIFLKTQ